MHTDIKLGLNLDLLDWIIFYSILATSIAFIIIGQALFRIKRKKVGQSLDYILMGRTLTLPLFVITLVSSWYGGVFGVTQISYNHGIYNFITQGFFWYLAYVFFAVFMAQRINQSKSLTMSDKIKEIYGKRSAKLAACLILLKGLPVPYAISIGLLLKNIFGISLEMGIISGCIFVVFYCSLGGLRAVVLSEVVHFMAMFAAVIAVVFISIQHFGGLEFLHNNLSHSYFTLTSTRGYSDLLLWLFIAFSATTVCPVFYQRCLAASSPKIARNGVLVSTIFWFIFDCCTTLGGMYAKASMPDLDPVDAYLVYAMYILPTGFKGLFLAGIVATILSTLDAFTFVTGTTVSYDLIPRKWSTLPWVRFLSLIMIGILTVAVAISFDGEMEKVWMTIEGYSGALLAIPIIWSHFVKAKASDRQFLTACISSLVMMITYDLFWPNKQLSSFYLGSATSLFILMSFSALQKYEVTKS